MNEQPVRDEAIDEMHHDMHPLARIPGILFSPVKTLRAIKESPSIWWALLIVPLFPVFYYVFFWSSYQVQLIEIMNLSAINAGGGEMDREALDLILTTARITTPIFTYIGFFFAILIPTAIYFGVGRLLKSKVTFKQTLSMILHVSVISGLLWIFHMLITMMFGQSNIMMPMSSAASLLPDSAQGSILAALLMPLDVFSIWYMIVLYMGLNIVCGYSRRAAGIAVTINILISIASSVWAVMMSGLAGMM